MLDRRTVMASGLSGLCGVAGPVAAEAEPKRVKLWPTSVSGVTEPTVSIHKVAAQTAVLVLPGERAVENQDGEAVCAFLNASGVSAGALLYLHPEGGPTDAALQDAKRALRLLKRETGAQRVGILGFSGGGIIAAAVATRWDEPLYPQVDDADAIEARPAFMALCNPWLGPPAAAAGVAPLYKGMNATAPPTFFILAADRATSINDSIDAFRQLRALNIPAAIHVFETGSQGLALSVPLAAPKAQWPALFLSWGRIGGHII